MITFSLRQWTRSFLTHHSMPTAQRRKTVHGQSLPQQSITEVMESRVLLAAAFPEFVDPNPNPGNQFGATIVPLSSGNVVVTSPFDDAGGTDAGAVYLFNGATGALISTLRGSSASDQIGESIGGNSNGAQNVLALSNGNFVVRSSSWDNGSAVNAGAVTWGSGVTGWGSGSTPISETNSLVGTSADHGVGVLTPIPVGNGNYAVPSPGWDNGTVLNVGAVT
jgi:hypothetical protein